MIRKRLEQDQVDILYKQKKQMLGMDKMLRGENRIRLYASVLDAGKYEEEERETIALWFHEITKTRDRSAKDLKEAAAYLGLSVNGKREDVEMRLLLYPGL
jgi:hypothetical protein